MRRVGLLCSLALSATATSAEDLAPASISQVLPLGGQRGTTIELRLLGRYLSNTKSVEFDSRDFVWRAAGDPSSGRLEGLLSIASTAALGTHRFRVRTLEGYSTSALFNVGQFQDVREVEPNDSLAAATVVASLPAGIQGGLDGAADIDIFAIDVRAGDRWVADFRSIEYGSAVEAKMFLLDADGHTVAFNDDRDDYLETPYIEHTFARAGRHYLKVDQYRGPRGFNFGKNSTYVLRISRLPTIDHVTPLGAAVGSTATLTLRGQGLGSVQDVYLTRLRGAEHARMTYPYTMPVRFADDSQTGEGIRRIEGEVLDRNGTSARVRFSIPDRLAPGLWRVWAAGPAGILDGPPIDLDRLPDYSETNASEADWRPGGYAINGVLSEPGERDVYAIHTVAGRPLHFWTLAAQLGVPHLDPVVSLRDASGRKLAENDDVVAGQGTLIGNPDSSLFHTPERDGVLFLTIEDRTQRGGLSYQYRLKVQEERPSFQLFTTPENFSVPRGGEAVIKVHLVRERGFEGRVAIWFEGMPPGVEAPMAEFREDQLFEPNADGADMIIPEIAFPVAVPESLQPGVYPIRVFGAPAGASPGPLDSSVQAGSTMTMGPLLDLWNFVRRPLPRIEMTVFDPPAARLWTDQRTLTLSRGGTATVSLKTAGLIGEIDLRVPGLPQGVEFESTAYPESLTVTLRASESADIGSFDISVEARTGRRWAATDLIGLTVRPSTPKRAGR